MPVTLNESALRIELHGACSVEEAETLKELLDQHPDYPVDAGACEYMHTAVVQVLVVNKPRWHAWPKPPHLRQALQHIFSGESAL